MTIILIIIFLICVILLLVLQSKNGLVFIWKNIGKPYIDYLFKPSDYKTAKLYLRSIVAILIGIAALKITCGVTEVKDGRSIQVVFGVDYGTIDLWTLLVVLVLVLMACCQFYFSYKKREVELHKRKKTLIVEYIARIATDNPIFDYATIQEALPNDYVPGDGSPYIIHFEGNVELFWQKGVEHLETHFNSLISYMKTANISHLSLFAIAPMPLLVKLGCLLNEKYHVEVYQRHRNPSNWNRLDNGAQEFKVLKPVNTTKQPVIAFSLSDDISRRITQLYNDTASIWHVMVDNPNMDMMRTLEQQNKFRTSVRDLLSEVSRASAYEKINIHMAVPVSCAIELGRVWMPKAHKSLEVYDYYNDQENKTITIKNNTI